MNLYRGGDDKFHLTPVEDDRLALVFANAITGADTVPPVTGVRSPDDDEQGVDPDREIQFDLFDFGAGIAVGQTRLLIDGEPVQATISGNNRRQPHPLPAAESLERCRLRRSRGA